MDRHVVVLVDDGPDKKSFAREIAESGKVLKRVAEVTHNGERGHQVGQLHSGNGAYPRIVAGRLKHCPCPDNFVEEREA